jgi:hypothetical protein
MMIAPVPAKTSANVPTNSATHFFIEKIDMLPALADWEHQTGECVSARNSMSNLLCQQNCQETALKKSAQVMREFT